MLASYSRMFQSDTVISEPNRLEQKINLKKALAKIKELREQESKLDKCAEKNGGDSIDRRKHIVVSSLLSNIDSKIKIYNESKSDTLNFVNETQETIKLILEISRLIKNCRDEHKEIINEHRSIKTLHAGQGVLEAAPFVAEAAILTAAAIELPFVAGVMVLMGGYVAGQEAKALFGVSTTSTRTSILFDELITILDATAQNQDLALRLRKPEEYKETACPIEYICPITRDIMKDPHVLNLVGDGRSYEKTAILRHLTEKRNSPLNRAEMKVEQKPEDVISPNYNLKILIEDYLVLHPEPKPELATPSSPRPG